MGFHPMSLEGFPRVFLVSYGWLTYMADLWDSYVADLFMIFVCAENVWQKVLKFKNIHFLSNIHMVSEHRERRSLVLCSNIILRISWSVEQNIANMRPISVRSKDRLEGASNFNTWKERVLNILEENDLDCFVTSVVGDPITNATRVN